MDNGDLNQQSQQQREQENKKGIWDRATDTLQSARKVQSRIESAQKTIRTIKTAATAVRTGAALLNPWVLGAIVVIVIIILLYIMLSGGGSRPDYDDYYGAPPSPVPGTDPGTQPPTNPLPGLTLTLIGPSPVPNKTNLTFSINSSYSGSQEIEILASIPQNTRFISATGNHNIQGNLISWRLSGNTPTESSGDQGTGLSGSTLALYQSYGFPAPANPRNLTDSESFRWETYLRPNAEKAASIVGVDIGFIGMWALLENSITTYMDNCLDEEFDPNTPCPGWGGNWQVGYGMHPAHDMTRIEEAMNAMHPGKTLKQIGDQVIRESSQQDKYVPGSRIPFAPITNPSSFPDVTIGEVIAGANSGNGEMRHLLGVILKDDAIGAYVLAKKFKSYVDSNNELTVAARMEGWGAYYDRNKVINYVAGIYNSGIVVNKYQFSFTVEPTADDFRVPNYTVSARYVNGGTDEF